MTDSKIVKCSPCQFKGESAPAMKFCVICDEALCKTCVSCHKSFKLTKSHNLSDCSSPASSSFNAAQRLSSYMICPDHEDRTVEVLCEDHNVLCCLTCFTLSHNTCQTYREIKKTAAGFKENGQSDQFRARLENLSSIMQEIIDTNKLRQSNFEKYKAEIAEQLKEIKNQLMSIYESIESDVMTKVESLCRDDAIASRSLEEKWKQKFDTNAEQLNLLDYVIEIGTDAQLFVTVHKLKESTGETERALEDQRSQIMVQRPLLKKSDKLEGFLQANTDSLVVLASKEVLYKLPLTSSYRERVSLVALDEETNVTSDVFDGTETKESINTNDNDGDRWLIKRVQPPGKMEVDLMAKVHIWGKEYKQCISIKYTFSSGIQRQDHSNTGRPYKGMTMNAYLPANKKGRELCEMLKAAFDRKLLFTILPSNVIACTIHHITDPYHLSVLHAYDLQRMKQELAEKGITSDDIPESYRTK